MDADDESSTIKEEPSEITGGLETVESQHNDRLYCFIKEEKVARAEDGVHGKNSGTGKKSRTMACKRRRDDASHLDNGSTLHTSSRSHSRPSTFSSLSYTLPSSSSPPAETETSLDSSSLVPEFVRTENASLGNNNVSRQRSSMKRIALQESRRTSAGKQSPRITLSPEPAEHITCEVLPLLHSESPVAGASETEDQTDDDDLQGLTIHDGLQSGLALQLKILQELRNLKKEVMTNRRYIMRIENQLTLDNEGDLPPAGLPIATRETFIALDSNEEELLRLRSYLVTVGGLDLRGALREFLRVTFTDSFVANNMNWSLSGNKIAFRETNISVTFFGACRRIQRLRQPVRASYESAMKTVLRNAAQRHYMTAPGRRKDNSHSAKEVAQRSEEALAARYDAA